MHTMIRIPFVAALAVGLAVAPPFAAVARAAAADFRFELVSARPAAAQSTDVVLRLTHLPDGKPVGDAVIFQRKAIMPGMEDMPASASVAPGAQPGLYLLHVETSMSGPWVLNLSAKLQGEAETLRAAVPFQAGP
jgi:hypothetical protein